MTWWSGNAPSSWSSIIARVTCVDVKNLLKNHASIK